MPVKPSRISPKVMVIYSPPKVGKTDELTKLPGCLIVDSEGGTEMYECYSVQVRSTRDLLDVCDAVDAAGEARYKEGKTGDDLFPFRFIALDTTDLAEEYAEISATAKYKAGPLNKNKKFEENGYTTITELPDGAGYPYVRNELKMVINRLAERCAHLILVCHIREKKLKSGSKKTDKDNEDVVVNDLSLMGKMNAIVCAMSDAIGYMYRSENSGNKGELMISFQTYDSSVMGARQKYLAGKKMPFNWATIYPDEFPNGLKVVSSQDGEHIRVD